MPTASIEKDQLNFNPGMDIRNKVFSNKVKAKHYSFQTFMQRIKLTFNQGTKEFSNKIGKNSKFLNEEWLWNN